MDQALTALGRARNLDPADQRIACDMVNCLILAGRFAEADAMVAEAVAARPVARMLAFHVWMKLYWNGDVAGTAASLRRWPAWFLREDRGAGLAAMVWLWQREPGKALEVLEKLPRDYVRDYWFTGPKAVLSAWAHERANHPEAARGDWQIVVQIADRELAATPGDSAGLHWKAWALARLGDTAAAERLLRLLEERWVSRGSIEGLPQLAGGLAGLALTLGQTDRAIELLTRICAAPVSETRGVNRAALRNNPLFDALRNDPRFQALIDAAPGPEEKKEAKSTTGTPVAPAPNEKSLVVLPLENLSPDPENVFFTDGMHAEIISTLQRILPELKVFSRPTALAFKEAKLSVAEFARKIGAAHVITGSVRRAGERLRVQLELRRANDDALLWASPKPERNLKDQFDIQSEVAEEVARVLQVRERRGSWAGAQFMTRNQEAYDLFLKAGATLEKSWFVGDEDRLRQARAVVELDPAFMPGVSHLSTTYAGLYRNARNPAERVAHAAEAKRWGEKASQMVPGGAGDGALSYYYSIIEGDYPRALAYAENLVRALPNDATGYNFLAIALSYLGRIREAEAATNRAIELNPLGLVFLRNHARLLARHRRLDEAERAMARFFAAGGPANDNAIADLRFWIAGKLPASPTTENGPANFIPARWQWRAGKFGEALAMADSDLKVVGDDSLRRHELLLMRTDALRRLNREKEAAEAAAELLGLAEQLQAVPEVGPSQKLGWLAAALARSGRFDGAIATAVRWVDTTPEGARPRQTWNRQILLAEIYAYAKRTRECVDVLSTLMRVPCELTVPMLRVDPAWDNVRDDAAFKALLADPKNSAPL